MLPEKEQCQSFSRRCQLSQDPGETRTECPLGSLKAPQNTHTRGPAVHSRSRPPEGASSTSRCAGVSCTECPQRTPDHSARSSSSRSQEAGVGSGTSFFLAPRHQLDFLPVAPPTVMGSQGEAGLSLSLPTQLRPGPGVWASPPRCALGLGLRDRAPWPAERRQAPAAFPRVCEAAPPSGSEEGPFHRGTEAPGLPSLLTCPSSSLPGHGPHPSLADGFWALPSLSLLKET